MVIFPFTLASRIGNEKMSLEDTLILIVVECSMLPVCAISEQLRLFCTNVVLGGDFSVFVCLTETEKVSLEHTFNSR